jgi:hypothetical protein
MKIGAGSADTTGVRVRFALLLLAGLLAAPSCAVAHANKKHHRKHHPVSSGLGSQRFGVVNAAGWGLQEASRATRLGISTDRIEFDPTDPPGYDDSLLVTDVSAGLRPLLVLNLYTDMAKLAQGDFSSWAARAAARYARGGAFWREHPELNSSLAPDYFELLNEPYSTDWYGPGTNAPAYAHLFAATVAAARNAGVRGGWLLAAGPHYTDAAGVVHDWDHELLASVPDIVHLAAGVTVHPYGTRSWTGDPDWGWSHLPVVHQDFPTLPVWITEVGYSSTKNTAGIAAGEQEKATAVRWYVRQTAATPWIKALFIYGYIDSGADPGNPEDNYGLISYPGTRALPAYDAYRQALAALKRCRAAHSC